MTVKEKLKDVKLDVLSVGLTFNDIDYLEFTEEEFEFIPKELLYKEVAKVKTYGTPTYIELVLK